MGAAEGLANDVFRIPTGISNAYLVGRPESWVLIDAGTEGYANKIRAAAKSRFGHGSRPEAILLTHGHFDHSGSAGQLARAWNVSIYARSARDSVSYRSIQISSSRSYGRRFHVPDEPVLPQQGLRLRRLSEASDRKCIHRTGAMASHRDPRPQSRSRFLFPLRRFVSDCRRRLHDHQSGFRHRHAAEKKQVCRPPAYYTCDWETAHESVEKLAALNPRILAAGHGEPMSGPNATRQLNELALHFPIPEDGRYVRQTPVMNEQGVVALPPPVPDPVPKIAAGVGIAAAAAAVAVGLAARSR